MAASSEQELDSCKGKTLLLTRENHNLQEELSEAYRLKSHLITEAFERAVEKNNQLEKEVKFYQSQMSTAFSERDKAIVEVERVHEAEKAMSAKVQQLQNRIDEAERQSKEQEAQKLELQHDFDTITDQLDTQCKEFEEALQAAFEATRAITQQLQSEEAIFQPEMRKTPSRISHARLTRLTGRSRKAHNKWTKMELKALVEGVRRYGQRWSVIYRSRPAIFKDRNPTSLKDKWRNKYGNRNGNPKSKIEM